MKIVIKIVRWLFIKYFAVGNIFLANKLNLKIDYIIFYIDKFFYKMFYEKQRNEFFFLKNTFGNIHKKI
jgi:hypothetical protein